MWDNWEDLISEAFKKAKTFGEEYLKRLEFENKEINKQGANQYWIDLINNKEKFDHNKNGLVLPFLFNITDIDPIKGQYKLCINGENKKIKGIEITLDNGLVINTSENTKIKTNRGFLQARDISENDEIYLS